MKIAEQKYGGTYSEGQYHRYTDKGSSTKTDLDSTNKILESSRSNNRANQAYGRGDTFQSAEAAVKRLGEFKYEGDTVQGAGGIAILEARARTYGTKTSRGAEAQASVFRLEYGGKYDQSFVTVGDGHEIVGAGAKGNLELFLGAQSKAEAGFATKHGLPYAYAGVYAFAGARAMANAAVEGRLLGVSLGAQGMGYAWAGAQAGAQATAGMTGIAAEAGAFAGAKAGVEGSVALFGIGIGGSAEASAGIGAEAGISAGLKDGEFKFSADAGAALGVGGGYGVDISVDLDTMIRDAEATAGTVGYLAQEAAEAAGEAAEDAGEAAGGAVEAIGNAAGDAADAAGDFIDSITPW